MAKKEETVEMEDRYEEYEDDVIVIKKSWLVTALVALVAFGLGGIAGYFVYGYAFQAGAGSQQPLRRRRIYHPPRSLPPCRSMCPT
jgi:hypothetical protein